NVPHARSGPSGRSVEEVGPGRAPCAGPVPELRRRDPPMLLLAPAALVSFACLVLAQDPAAAEGTCCRTERKPIDPALLRQDRKSVLLRDLAKSLTEGKSIFFGEGTLRELEERFAKLPPNSPPTVVGQLCSALGQARLEEGK